MHYAPNRTCDLLHLEVDIAVDYPSRTFTGTSRNRMAALRNGIQEVSIMAGTGLTILNVTLNGQLANYRREKDRIYVSTGTLKKGQEILIGVSYSQANSKGTGFGTGGGGFHWIEATPDNPTRVGFWTQGETNYNSQWAPTWDYPNDLATSRVNVTVQSDWIAIGNGSLTRETTSGNRKTYGWTMTQPHATYLLSLAGGPLDIKKDKWQDVDLWYVVPRGKGKYIDDSFGNTKDMLTYFSNVLGVKYPWPKYAQNAMYDFGGGMENVSATTLGQNSLTDKREGHFDMDSLNAHELAHQWFGDLVNCMHWGDAWLNESFATLFQILYFEHSRGAAAYDHEIEGSLRSYLAESRRYKRPLATKLYANPDVNFDSHAYPKGALIMHTLRKQIGDEAFFQGLNYYLTKWRHTPVESAQLRRAFLEGTGLNVEQFWDQWIDKPGHPVIEYSWTLMDRSVMLNVKQTQNTADGTPIYIIPAKVGFITKSGQRSVQEVLLSKVQDDFTLNAPADTVAVILDPGHDFLREIVNHKWSPAAAEAILTYGWNAVDRQAAFSQVVAAGNRKLALDTLATDLATHPAITQSRELAVAAEESQRAFWMKELGHANFGRRANAVLALGKLGPTQEAVAAMKSVINGTSPIDVVVNAIRTLQNWDAKAHRSTFESALGIEDMRSRIKRTAEQAIQMANR